MNEVELTRLFRQLGARDPENWARSQVREGIPQLARFLFLRQAWKQIVPEDDASWMDAAVQQAEARPDEPYAGVGHAIKKLRGRGATDEEITDIVRGMQAELLFALCYLLEDAGDLEDETASVAWSLVQVGASGDVVGPIGGLHESVLETDPTGREMRPRRASD